MNEKQGEHLDRRIRQSLARLPDGPPPGSVFDGGRLWEQLRPELTAQPVVAKKRIGGWWLAAASVVGLLAEIWWFQYTLLLPDTQSVRRERGASQTTLANPANKRPVRKQTEDETPNSISGNSSVETRNQTVHRTKASSSVVPENQVHTGQQNWPDSPIEYHALTQTEQPVLPESTTQSIPISITKPIVATAAKRGLVLPLNRKSTQ